MKFLIDTNVYIYFRLFTDCDWKKLLECDDLTLLITPTIIGEIDKLKNDSRKFANKRARELGAIFDKIDSGSSTAFGIKIDFPEQSIRDFDWDAYNLDKSRSDDNIIAELLSINDLNNKICIVTEDSLMKRKAKARKITPITPPEEWRREQKDPRDKKIAELQALIEQKIPEVKLRLLDRNENKGKDTLELIIEIPEIKLIDDKYIENELSQIKREIKDRLNERSYFLLSSGTIKRYEDKLRAYPQECEEYFKECNRIILERSFSINISFILENLGNIPADDLDIWINFPNGLKVFEELPEFPDMPGMPSCPSSDWDPSAIDFPSITSPLSDIWDRQKELIGPEIESSTYTSVHYKLKKLKHGLDRLLPLFISFKSIEDIHSFQIEYNINIGNHPKETKGVLLMRIMINSP